MDGSKEIPLYLCSPTGCCHGKIQSDLLYSIQVCWRELGPHQEGLLWPSHEVRWIPCWLGSYFSSFLDDFHSVLHPRIFSLSRLAGWASTPTPLGAPSLVVRLGLTTSWRRTTERKLSGLWGCCDGTFHTFHQVLGWSSCLRSPTNRHALVLPVEFVSPDSDCHSWFYHCPLSLRRLRWVPVPMHSPSVVSRNPHDIRATDGYGAIIRPSPPGPPSLATLHLGSN